jgi:TRAP-type uncharacterized transport system substrate-binding protein
MKSDLPCSDEIPFPYIKNIVDYKDNEIVKIVSGPVNSMNNTMCDLFINYANNIDVKNIESFDNYNNIDILLTGKADIAFSSEDILFDYLNSQNTYKGREYKVELEFVCSLQNQFLILFVPIISRITTFNMINNGNILVLNNASVFELLLKALNIKANYITYDISKKYTLEELQLFDGFFCIDGYDTTIINNIIEKVECKFVPINIPTDVMSFYFPMFRKNKFDSTLFIDYNNKNVANMYVDTYSSRVIIICRKNTSPKKVVLFLNFIYNFIVSHRNRQIIPRYYGNDTNNDITEYMNNLDTMNNRKKKNAYANNNPFFDQISIKRVDVDTGENNNKRFDNKRRYTPLDELSVGNLIYVHKSIPLNKAASIFYEKLGYSTTNNNRACALIAGKYECTDRNLDAINITDLDELFDNYNDDLNKSSRKRDIDKKTQIDQFTNSKGYMCINPLSDGIGDNTYLTQTFGISKISCENNMYIDGVPKVAGIWDKQCRRDDECPFYKKNMNYPNTRGGCKNGFCEMPVNVKRVGFTNYLNKDNYLKYSSNGTYQEPYCYNCDDGTNTCCEKQAKPDYAFKDDLMERYEYRENLKWANHN